MSDQQIPSAARDDAFALNETQQIPSATRDDAFALNETQTILPPNATPLERAAEQATATRIEAIPVPIENLINVDHCPAGFLPFLAWGLSVEDWDSDWSDNIKRQVIKSSFAIHKIKGTVAAVEMALNALDIPAILQEWFEYNGDPYHYRIALDLSTRGASIDDLIALQTTVTKAANVRSVMDAMQINLTRIDPLPKLAIAPTQGQSVMLYPVKANSVKMMNSIHYAMGAGSHNIISIYPMDGGSL
ncbi:MAG: phage tail protein I [Alphaproteobacteria bacterium]